MMLVMNDHTRPRSGAVLAACFFLSLIVLLAGCAGPGGPGRRFSELLAHYPGTDGPLRITRIMHATANDVPSALRDRTVTVIVHPGYSLFFREEHKNTFSQVMYDLLKLQFDREARFVQDAASAGSGLLILVLPGNYERDSIAPRSYISYLNLLVGSSPTVYYITSESSSSGDLDTDSMVDLHAFLRQVGAKKVLVGGGYIGRCEQEFYSQLTTYFDRVPSYLVPELSSVSPDDIDDDDARTMLQSIRRSDYGPITKFIEQKQKSARIRHILPAF